jgi:cell division protease FtsH
MTLPMEDKFLVSREELIDELAMLLGGRVAEELQFGDMTTGAQNDLDRATKVARQMVTEYGMSDVLGPLTLGQKQDQVFLGRDFASHPDYSEQVAFEIDSEIRTLIDRAHDEALEILTDQRGKLDVIAGTLIEKETIEKDELVFLLEGVSKRPQRESQLRGAAGIAVARRTTLPPAPGRPEPIS